MLKKVKEATPGNKNILIKPRVDVAIFLQNQIFAGQKILDKEIRADDELHNIDREKTKWHKFNLNYLMSCFNTDCIAKEYDSLNTSDLTINPRFYEKTKSFAYSDDVDHTFRRKWITDSDASGSLIPNDVDHSERSDAYFNYTTKSPFCLIF